MTKIYHSRENTMRMLLIFKDNLLRSLPGGDIHKRLLRFNGKDAALHNANKAQAIFDKACLRAGVTKELKPYSDSGAPLIAD
jgi:hypothetical protein